MQRIEVTEGQPITGVDLTTAQAIRERLVSLREELKPRMRFLGGDSAAPTVQNLVGTVQVTQDVLVDIAPKTMPGENWTAAVYDLIRAERVSYEGQVREAEVSPRLYLPDALAHLYAQQLGDAIRRAGPLSVIVPARTTESRLRGRLDVTRWTTSRILRPHIFPQQRTSLTTDNAFTSAMAWVAETLASRSSDPSIAQRLRALRGDLRPGLALHATLDPGVAARPLPPQWREYADAWVTACAVIRRVSPLRRSGVQEGLGLAVEPWPLLETLLHRSVRAAARQAQREGVPLVAGEHSLHDFLGAVDTEPGVWAGIHTDRQVDPDATLSKDGRIVVAFEAKYSVPTPERTRSHFFQAVSTAAAVGADLSVLVYPDALPPVRWDATGFADRPKAVVAVGLDMYGYRSGTGEAERGELLLEAIRKVLPAGGME